MPRRIPPDHAAWREDIPLTDHTIQPCYRCLRALARGGAYDHCTTEIAGGSAARLRGRPRRLSEVYRLTGGYAGRVLKGEKPTDLPVLLPTKFETIINPRTAKALGIQIPDKLLALADEVLE